MLAREYFEQVRNAAKELENARRTMEMLRNREGLKAQRYSSVGHSTTLSEPMAATDSRIDFELEIQRGRFEEATVVVDDAMRLLFGGDGNGGLSALAGYRYAEVLMHYYCRAESWHQVSEILGKSRTSCKHLRNEALDLVDDFGFAHLKESVGYSKI